MAGSAAALLVTTIITAACIVYIIRRIQLLEQDLRLLRLKKGQFPVQEVERIAHRAFDRHVRSAAAESRADDEGVGSGEGKDSGYHKGGSRRFLAAIQQQQKEEKQQQKPSSATKEEANAVIFTGKEGEEGKAFGEASGKAEEESSGISF